MSLTQQLTTDLEQFMKKFKMTQTALGLNALGSPHAIFRFLRGTNDPRLSTVDRLYEYMDKQEARRKK